MDTTPIRPLRALMSQAKRENEADATRHCEERSRACRERSVAEAIQQELLFSGNLGLLRFARNDGLPYT